MVERDEERSQFNYEGPVKVIAFSATGLIVSLGLCGLSATGYLGSFFVSTGTICFLGSLLGLVGGFCWLLVGGLFYGIKR